MYSILNESITIEYEDCLKVYMGMFFYNKKSKLEKAKRSR